jgi:hypothetical protein
LRSRRRESDKEGFAKGFEANKTLVKATIPIKKQLLATKVKSG